MRRVALVPLIALIGVVCSMSVADAQGEVGVGFRGWGPRLGLTLDPDQIHFGFHLDLGNFAKNVRLQPNLELGFGDDQSVLAINAETTYRFLSKWDVWSPYLGGSVGINFINRDSPWSDDTEFGLSAVGGIERGLSSGDRFFTELKLGLIDSPDFKITVGWTFGG